MAKRRHKKVRTKKTCDPALCDNCVYIGEGDFLCDEHQEIVVSDWMPTEFYLMCDMEGTNG